MKSLFERHNLVFSKEDSFVIQHNRVMLNLYSDNGVNFYLMKNGIYVVLNEYPYGLAFGKTIYPRTFIHRSRKFSMRMGELLQKSAIILLSLRNSDLCEDIIPEIIRFLHLL